MKLCHLCWSFGCSVWVLLYSCTLLHAFGKCAKPTIFQVICLFVICTRPGDGCILCGETLGKVASSCNFPWGALRKDCSCPWSAVSQSRLRARRPWAKLDSLFPSRAMLTSNECLLKCTAVRRRADVGIQQVAEPCLGRELCATV